MSTPITLVWLRRDLRLHDHAALAHALTLPGSIQPVFVFDEAILAPLRSGTPESALTADRRVSFIHQSLESLGEELAEFKGSFIAVHGLATQEIPRLARELKASHVVYAGDDEPDALLRDATIESSLATLGIKMVRVKDQCIFERDEVLTGAGGAFSVFTPYKNAWLKRLEADPGAIGARDCSGLAGRLARHPSALPSLASMSFDQAAQTGLKAGSKGAQALLQDFLGRMGRYRQARDFPSVRGPSYLSVHLRFGTISVRELVRHARTFIQSHPAEAEGAQTWLSELIWRDFYMQILWHHPHVVGASFRPEYDRVCWLEENEEFARLFSSWCEGKTGYPIVDAGMRQLNESGYMHNRLRMVVASFLTKDLGIHWKHGERYFARHLNDFDLSANNGGWQWAASTGCDAQPYFRIFNPVSQSERFDPKGAFIRRYVPEIASLDDKHIHAPWLAPALVLQASGVELGRTYPNPIVDHAQAREATLARFAVVKKKA